MLSILRVILCSTLTILSACGSPESEVSILSEAAYPTCSARATDPDGDGWGWEASTQRSCRMTPTCSPRAIDPDGDGWGWEESTRISCKMASPQLAGGACAYVGGTTCSASGECRIYPSDGTRAGVKNQIWNTMYNLNKGRLSENETLCRADLAVAIAMQEAHSFATNSQGNLPYDATKDGMTNGAQNVSIFNMNIDFIKLSCKNDCSKFQNFSDTNQKKYLNSFNYLSEAVTRLNEGFNYFGLNQALHFHRGGRTGWLNPTNDEKAYARSQLVVADHLRNNSSERQSDSRISYSIVHR